MSPVPSPTSPLLIDGHAAINTPNQALKVHGGTYESTMLTEYMRRIGNMSYWQDTLLQCVCITDDTRKYKAEVLPSVSHLLVSVLIHGQ